MKNEGKIFIYPTDTVWGIGAFVSDERCNVLVREIKGNVNNKPLLLMFESFSQLSDYIEFPKRNSLLIKAIFEMGTSILFPENWEKKRIPSWVKGNESTIGVRIAAGPLTRLVSEKKIPFPITTTSLNKSGMGPITSLADAKEFYNSNKTNFPEIELVYPSDLKDQELQKYSSTLIDFSKRVILRRGAAADEVQVLLNELSPA